MKKREQYINVPYYILNKKVSDKAKLLYGFIGGFFDGQCGASNEYLAKLIGCSPRQIKRVVKELKDNKLILTTNIIKNNLVVGRVLKLVKKK